MFGRDGYSDDEWYSPGESRHLSQAEVEALAGNGSVSPLALEHYVECDECRRDVSRVEKWLMGGGVGGDIPGFAGGRDEEPYETLVRYEHLSFDEIEAIAVGRSNTVSPSALTHYESCGECQRDVARRY